MKEKEKIFLLNFKFYIKNIDFLINNNEKNNYKDKNSSNTFKDFKDKIFLISKFPKKKNFGNYSNINNDNFKRENNITEKNNNYCYKKENKEEDLNQFQFTNFHKDNYDDNNDLNFIKFELSKINENNLFFRKNFYDLKNFDDFNANNFDVNINNNNIKFYAKYFDNFNANKFNTNIYNKNNINNNIYFINNNLNYNPINLFNTNSLNDLEDKNILNLIEQDITRREFNMNNLLLNQIIFNKMFSKKLD